MRFAKAPLIPIPHWFAWLAVVLVLVSLFEGRIVRALRRGPKRRNRRR